MHSVFVITLLSLVAQAHPNDSIDRLGDKLAFTLSKSVEKLADTMAHSVDNLGDTLADKLGDKLADRVFVMKSPHKGDLDSTVHAKPGAGPRVGQTGFPSPSFSKTPSLRAPLAATRPLEYGSRATVGRVNLRDLYSPVHTAAEAKALAGAGLGYHVRRPAPVTGEHEMRLPEQSREYETAEQGGDFDLPRGRFQHPFKFSPEAAEFVPRAFKHTPETPTQPPFNFSPFADEFAPKGVKSPLERSFVDTKPAILHDMDASPMMIPTGAPELDIDSVIDRDISSRKTTPGKHGAEAVESPKAWAFTHPKLAAFQKSLETPRSAFPVDAPEFARSR